MNLAEIKKTLNLETINLDTVVAADGTRTEWMKHWDNTNRIAVLVHKETLAKIKADKNLSTLGLKTEKKQGALGEYTAQIICIYRPAEETL